jgi:hypothetical protein
LATRRGDDIPRPARGRGHRVRRRDARRGREPLRFDRPVVNVDVSPDGSRLAAAGGDGVITMLDPATQQRVSPPLRAHDGAVGSRSFSPVGTRLARGATGRIVALWDVVRRERVGRLTPGKPTTPVVALVRPRRARSSLRISTAGSGSSIPAPTVRLRYGRSSSSYAIHEATDGEAGPVPKRYVTVAAKTTVPRCDHGLAGRGLPRRSRPAPRRDHVPGIRYGLTQ